MGFTVTGHNQTRFRITRPNNPRFHLAAKTTSHKSKWVVCHHNHVQIHPVGEQVATSPTKKNKDTRNRQKRSIQTDEALWQNAWTTEEEIVLAKGWCAASENSQHGNARKKDVFWCEVLAYIKSQTKQEGRQTYDVGWENRGRCAWPWFGFVGWSEGSNKRHKSSGSSSFNTESMDASINLNTIVADEDEVQEIRRPGGRDKARAAAKNNGSKASGSSTMNGDALARDKARAAAKNNGSKASGSSTMNDDALARLMVNEMTSAEVQQRKAFMELKMREVECRKREIAATEYRAQQEDIKLYLQPYHHLTVDQRLAMDEIRAKIKAKYNLQY
nr:hypothetical protein [Tanacetum cinerariifolium]